MILTSFVLILLRFDIALIALCIAISVNLVIVHAYATYTQRRSLADIATDTHQAIDEGLTRRSSALHPWENDE